MEMVIFGMVLEECPVVNVKDKGEFLSLNCINLLVVSVVQFLLANSSKGSIVHGVTIGAKEISYVTW
jgi:hypothetical protein